MTFSVASTPQCSHLGTKYKLLNYIQKNKIFFNLIIYKYLYDQETIITEKNDQNK